MDLINKQDIINELVMYGYNAENYKLGIKVHMNSKKYIDISREKGNILILDVYTKKGIDPHSLDLLEDHGRIRFESLIIILNLIKHKF